MVKAFISSLILLIILTSTYAQTPIGLKYDCDGYAFNNYFDPLTYSPTKKLTKVHNSDSYEIGYYFDKSGKKVSGLIKFQDKKIWFKVGKKEYRNKIKPEDIKEFVIGVDSFFTISKYYYKNSLKTKPVFVQFISTFNNYTFAKHYHFKSMVIQGQSPIVETYLVKSNGSDTWENFPDNNKFKEKALKYFNHIPYLKTKISSGEYKSKDMLSIIKMAEYYDKHKSSKAILYDKYWQETRDVKKAEYTAKITDIKDTTWTLEYYRNSTKLYQANYTSFFPNTKNGDFIAYYSNGETRQIISYDNNMPKEVKFYNESGQLKKH